MPRSIPTQRLNHAAHELGDEYYRCVTLAARSRGDLERCIDLGRSYLVALENLQKHLLSLPFDAEVDLLMQTTEGHLTLVRNELVHLETDLS